MKDHECDFHESKVKPMCLSAHCGPRMLGQAVQQSVSQFVVAVAPQETRLMDVSVRCWVQNRHNAVRCSTIGGSRLPHNNNSAMQPGSGGGVRLRRHVAHRRPSRCCSCRCLQEFSTQGCSLGMRPPHLAVRAAKLVPCRRNLHTVGLCT